MSTDTIGTFAVISGGQVRSALTGRESDVVALVEETYRRHGSGDTVNPPSYFLRFPDRPRSRIIALPASIGTGPRPVDGIKWISSFPDNVDNGIPRASAVLVLNDVETGYPFACLESSIISATRTAASAALAADVLTRDRPTRPTRIGFVGTGLIARYIHGFLAATGWSFDRIGLHDAAPAGMDGFHGYLESAGVDVDIAHHATARELIQASDIVVFATNAGEPHVHDASWFAHNPLVLHISLRDLSPEIILSSTNVVDDVEHCLKANTSPHLAELRSGSRDFVDGTLPEVLEGTVTLPADKPIVFSPFGLGVLDLAVGTFVYDAVTNSGDLLVIDDFFHERTRFG